MTTETTTTTDVAVVRAGFEAFANGDVAGFADMFAPDATWNHRNDDRLGGIHQGSDGIMAFIGESAQLTAGTLRAEPQAMMGDGQGNVAVLVRVSATAPTAAPSTTRRSCSSRSRATTCCSPAT